MSTRLNRLSQAPGEGTIDLTGDDSDVTTISDPSPRPPTRRSARSLSNGDDRTPRAPPFTQGQTHQNHEVIDLSDESDFEVDGLGAENDIESGRTAHTLSSSPEVQFLGEQPAPPGNRRPDRPRPPRRNPSPQHLEGGGPFGYLPDLFRRGTQFMFGTVAHNNNNTYDQMFRDLRSDNAARANVDTQEITIQMDYRRPAFALGPLAMFDRSSETPQVVEEPYKAPPAPRDGFIRTFTEEEIVLCPHCGDELAVGKSDTKQQVWVVKNCGHVYCGDCASQRAAKATPRKKASSKAPQKLEKCVVDDCASKLTGKLAMFPIYL
ncbi:hypothetical protein H2204_001402 [Knufia peltigerae]|uniref:RING finger domain protein n=1 Tax=Knufia peltigerae TaxID=1002370 RepID=A0AA39D2N3_9EURO|nr:hypothetical protein H2204_001402 [Knufia peltigerae]